MTNSLKYKIFRMGILPVIKKLIFFISDVKERVEYDVTVVRLLSSGYYDNSVTVAISPIVDDSLLDSASGL